MAGELKIPVMAGNAVDLPYQWVAAVVESLNAQTRDANAAIQAASRKPATFRWVDYETHPATVTHGRQ